MSKYIILMGLLYEFDDFEIDLGLSNHENVFCSLAPSVYIISPWLLIPSLESRLRAIFWWYLQSDYLTSLKSYQNVLLSSTVSAHNSPMVPNTFIRKSATEIILVGLL